MPKNEIYYAGIGSRETPIHVLNTMTKLGKFMAELDFVLRSGAAPGADSAFEDGCDLGSGKKEIFLPWAGFQNHSSTFIGVTNEARSLAATIHPRFHSLITNKQNLIARNMHQILGADLQTPVSFVLCWTPDGCENHHEYSQKTGGTGSAIACASKHDIPVFNLKNDQRVLDFEQFLFTLLKIL